jgi:hypothetical protein
MYDISQAIISAQIPPIAYEDVESNSGVGSNYHIPLNYTADVLFAQTAQGLVQGMVTKWQTNVQQQVLITATFGTSKPVLLCTIMGISLVLSLIATLASTFPDSARHAAALDVLRLLAISRNPELDQVLQPYSDRNVKMENEVLNSRVGYGWVDGLNRHALMIDSPVLESKGRKGQHGDGNCPMLEYDGLMDH